jgi:hypothetical protein
VVFLQLLLPVQSMVQTPWAQPPLQIEGHVGAPGGSGSSPQTPAPPTPVVLVAPAAPPLAAAVGPPPGPAWPPSPVDDDAVPCPPALLPLVTVSPVPGAPSNLLKSSVQAANAAAATTAARCVPSLLMSKPTETQGEQIGCSSSILFG